MNLKIFLLSFLIPLTLFARIPYRVSVFDPSNALGSQKAGVLANLDAAIKDWSRLISSKGQLWIQIEVTDNTPTGRFSGGSTGSKFLKRINGHNIYDRSGTYKMRTGKAVNSSIPDIVLQISPKFMNRAYWIDPNPTLRTSKVPDGRMDLVTVLAHELGHGFGMEGWININTGDKPDHSGLSVYDSQVSFQRFKGPVFMGRNALVVNGFLAPVTFFLSWLSGIPIIHKGLSFIAALSPTQNIYHIGRFNKDKDEDSDLSFFSLMAGSWQLAHENKHKGWRIHPNALDAAVMKDLGIPAAYENP